LEYSSDKDEMVIIVLSHSIILEDYKIIILTKKNKLNNKYIILTCDVFLEYVANATGKTEQFSFRLLLKHTLSYPDNVIIRLIKIEHNTSNKS